MTRKNSLTMGTFYGRYSSDEQGLGDSMRRQMSGGREYARANGIRINKYILDEGISGYRGENLKRGNLGKWLASVKEGKITPGSVLLVESIDRLSRNLPTVQFTVLVQILSAGIDIVTFGDGKRYSFDSINRHPHDLFGALGIIVRANDEAETRSRRGKQNWIQKRKRAFEEKLTAKAPVWSKLRADRKGWDLIPERVKLVKRIFAMAVSGKGTHMTAEQLNREAIAPWGGGAKWDAGSIAHILKSRAVCGEYQPHAYVGKKLRQPLGPPIPNYYPQIIEPALFERANGCKPRKSGVGKNVENLFGEMTFDGQTGERLAFLNAYRGKTHSFLFRQRTNRQRPCEGWDYSMFENGFLFHMNKIDWADLLTSPMHENVSKEKHRLEAEKSGTQRTLDRMVNMLVDEAEPPRTLVKEMKALEAKLAAVEQELADLKQNANELLKRQRLMKDAKAEFGKLLKARNRDARLRLRHEIRTLVERVDFWDLPGTCAEVMRLTPLVKDAMRRSGWEFKSDPMLWPCYRITFTNGAVRWVLCERIRVGRREASDSVNPAQNNIVFAPWASYLHENGIASVSAKQDGPDSRNNGEPRPLNGK
ncbi:MAG: recombinase family protein [Verrucomicrobia bacterium]|jgi:DNA invertase Pin-like site-specific DNA recombinase|nr:recombinase family protein [Verrucomicrobiota bacterium]